MGCPCADGCVSSPLLDDLQIVELLDMIGALDMKAAQSALKGSAAIGRREIDAILFGIFAQVQ